MRAYLLEQTKTVIHQPVSVVHKLFPLPKYRHLDQQGHHTFQDHHGQNYIIIIPMMDALRN